jgi:hypothetical protein
MGSHDPDRSHLRQLNSLCRDAKPGYRCACNDTQAQLVTEMGNEEQ